MFLKTIKFYGRRVTRVGLEISENKRFYEEPFQCFFFFPTSFSLFTTQWYVMDTITKGYAYS